MDTQPTLSSNEQTALEYLARKRSVLVSQIDTTNQTDVFGCVVPGRGVFNKLIKKGLALETEEPVLEDGFQFTPMLEITEEGERLAKHLSQSPASPTVATRLPRA